jgi:hypothetical protein
VCIVAGVNRELELEYNGAAASFLERVGLGDEPVNPFDLAALYDFDVEHAGSRANSFRMGPVIGIDLTATKEQQGASIGHELGHVACVLAGCSEHDEYGAWAVARRLLCPDRPFMLHVRAMAWDIARIKPLYPWASWELLARRLADRKAAIITIVDKPPNCPEHQHCRLWSTWLHTDYGPKPFDVEREAIEQAFATHEHVYLRGNRVAAYFVANDEGWQRVILICAAEDLEELVFGIPADVG